MNKKVLNYGASISGKVNNCNLPPKKGLLAVFEAVANSIYAIKQKREAFDDSFIGEIKVEIIRENSLFEGVKGRIDSFVIEDDGVGFNEANMLSFLTFDSTYKEKDGGKGNGRFSWLKAFTNVTIESSWLEGDKYYKRKFSFNTSNEEVEDNVTDSKENKSFTIISLEHIKEPYASKITNDLGEISTKTINHFIVDLINEKCPSIYLIDNDEIVCVNNVFKKNYIHEDNKIGFQIDNYSFVLYNIKISDKSFGDNKLYYCANGRLVDERKLGELIPNLNGALFEEEGYWYLGVLTGDYLDRNVDVSRQSFNIDEEEGSLFGSISKQRINKETTQRIKEYLKDELEKIETKKEQRITTYINENAPEYKALLKYKKEEVTRIKPNASDSELEDSLSTIRRVFERETKEECDSLIEKVGSKSISAEQYQSEFEEIIRKVSEMNQSILAKYVAKRRLVLNLFAQGLKMKEDGKFELESYMHELIYPMGQDSTGCPYDKHNLWLIDEKLSYSVYIASDVPFNKDRKEKRPDILILNSPVAVADSSNDGTEFSSVTLFELKRPDRDDYSPSDNPVKQLLDYITKIRKNEVRDANGRLIRVNNNTKYYLYIIADVTPSLKEILEMYGFNFSDSDNAYSHNPNYNAYLEVLSYDRILRDAEKRNKVFFEKLGI